VDNITEARIRTLNASLKKMKDDINCLRGHLARPGGPIWSMVVQDLENLQGRAGDDLYTAHQEQERHEG
jgi:hypothetical protein